MNCVVKVLIFVISLSSIESVAASSKKFHKASYVVKNYPKLPKKMPKLKMKQERIVKTKRAKNAVVAQPQISRKISSENVSAISDPAALIQALAE